MKAVKGGFSAKDVVTMAITTLEDFSCTNAGIGSNLTKSGTVESDASIMDGQSLAFGAVGALKGVRNPIQVAGKLLEEEVKGPSALGLVPPIFLAGEGAFQWALEHGLTTCHDEDLITDRSTQTWKKCKSRLQLSKGVEEKHKQVRLENLCQLSNEDVKMDTVGAVCMDTRGQLCAGVSSGGVVYKTPGRIGQAAVYGSGCWATKHDGSRVGVACCTSGCGEHLIKTMLAKECADLALTRNAVSAVQEGLGDKFLGSAFLSSIDQKLGGVLLLRVEGGESADDCSADLVWGHTTESMCIGYMAEQDKKPKVRLSRLQKEQQHPLLVEGTVYRLPHR
ncbi:threonine aspartase 1-like isoform X2 [Oculina patagonica]